VLPASASSQFFANGLANDTLEGLGLNGLFQRFVDQRLVTAVACLGLALKVKLSRCRQ
jgi:hypothetical protein